MRRRHHTGTSIFCAWSRGADRVVWARHKGFHLQPALAKVLEKTGQTVGGFFQRIGRTAVSLQALASRALALPGMVRNKIASGVVRIEDAVQGALSDFHTATAQRIDNLRNKAAEVAENAYGRVVGAGIDVIAWPPRRGGLIWRVGPIHAWSLARALVKTGWQTSPGSREALAVILARNLCLQSCRHHR